MKHEYTALIEQDEGWYVAYCPEIPEAHGQGKTIEEAKESLAEAIELIHEIRVEEALKIAPAGAVRETVEVG